jgi:hypothetical protein
MGFRRENARGGGGREFASVARAVRAVYVVEFQVFFCSMRLPG